MAKKSSGSSARGRRVERKEPSTWIRYEPREILEHFLKDKGSDQYGQLADDEINFSDIPELSPDQMKKARRAKVGRPRLGLMPRQTISMKIDPLLLQRLKRIAKQKGVRYQSLAHQILEQFVEREK